MSRELMEALEQVGRGRGIDRNIVAGAMEQAILSAAKKNFGVQQDIRAVFDEAGKLHVYAGKSVVDDVANHYLEIIVDEAKLLNAEVEVGDVIQVEVDPKEYGRIAAQTFKQVVAQRLREAEREGVFEEFKNRQGDLVNGVVGRIDEHGNVYLDLNGTESILPRKEQVFRENAQVGERMRAYLLEVRKSSNGPQLVISRTHPLLVRKLFELEVPEISDGTVEIKAIAREAGSRTKLCVSSRDEHVDPVGACVGMKGARVQAVTKELRGEKVDIIPWTDDPAVLVARALAPAKVSRVVTDRDTNTAEVVVPEDQLSLAIGKKGQNAKLAARLTGWRIDILSEAEYAEAQRGPGVARAAEATADPNADPQGSEETAVSPGETVAAPAGPSAA